MEHNKSEIIYEIEELKLNIDKTEMQLQEMSINKQFNLMMIYKIMKLKILKGQIQTLKCNLDFIKRIE